MHIFDTNKVPRVVLQFSWIGTRLGGKGTNVPHELGTIAPPGTTGPAGAADLTVAASPAGAAAPAPCHIFGPSQVFPHVHKLDEQD
jgi:hypothetical protein